MSEFTEQMENCNTAIYEMQSMKNHRSKELLGNQTEKERAEMLTMKKVLDAKNESGKPEFSNDIARKNAVNEMLFNSIPHQGILDKIQQLQTEIEDIDNQISFQKRLYRINELLEMRDQNANGSM